MNLESKNRKVLNWLLVILVSVAIIVILAVHNMGKKQNEEMVNYFAQYQNAVNIMYETDSIEDINGVNQVFENLLEVYPDSYQVYWRYGISYALIGDYQEAITNLNKAQNIRPFLIMEPSFCLQMGEIYFYNGEILNSKVYLEHSMQLGLSDEQQEYATYLLEEINNQLNISMKNPVME